MRPRAGRPEFDPRAEFFDPSHALTDERERRGDDGAERATALVPAVATVTFAYNCVVLERRGADPEDDAARARALAAASASTAASARAREVRRQQRARNTGAWRLTPTSTHQTFWLPACHRYSLLLTATHRYSPLLCYSPARRSSFFRGRRTTKSARIARRRS